MSAACSRRTRCPVHMPMLASASSIFNIDWHPSKCPAHPAQHDKDMSFQTSETSEQGVGPPGSRSQVWQCPGTAGPAQHPARARSAAAFPPLPACPTATCTYPNLSDLPIAGQITTYSGAPIRLLSSHVTTLCALGGPHNCNSADGKFMPMPVTPPTEIKNQEVARPGIALCGLPCNGCTGVMPCGRTRKHSLSSATMRL